MAKEIENLNINGEIFEFSKIYAKMGLTFERFVELIGRDLYCPTMDSEPTSSTLTYVDTDGSVNNFQIGQMCRWSDGDDYRVAICTSATPIETSWYILPKEMSNVQAVDTVDELDDVETNTYLKYTAQNLTEAQKAQARANIGVSASNSSSGSGSTSGGNGAYAEVNHGTSDTTFTLTPNTFHVWDEVASLDLSFSDEQAGVANEYLFQFTSGATATTLTLPDGLKWANDNAPTIAENMIYQVSVLKGLASVLEFNNAVELIDNKAILTNAQDGEVTFQYPVASTVTVRVRGDMIDSIIFNEGEQTKSASESTPAGYTIVSVTPNKDNIYNYIF